MLKKKRLPKEGQQEKDEIDEMLQEDDYLRDLKEESLQRKQELDEVNGSGDADDVDPDLKEIEAMIPSMRRKSSGGKKNTRAVPPEDLDHERVKDEFDYDDGEEPAMADEED